jgi:hypothetical protein
MKKALLIAAILFSSSVCWGQASYTTFGQPDCGQWLKQPSATQQTWLFGFISGLNAMNDFHAFSRGQPQQDLLKKLSSSDQLVVWMDTYCQRNPLSKLGEAGFILLRELGSK